MSDPQFPSRLKASRKAKGYTQAQVAEAIGVTVQAVSQWETGQSGASHGKIERLAKLLGVDWDWLGYGAELPDPSAPQTVDVNQPGEFQKAPMCHRGEIATWIRHFPNLDVEIDDALDLVNSDEKNDIYRQYFEPGYPPTGIIFATGIQSLSMAEKFQRGEVLIFDTGIKPAPGDYALIYIPCTDWVIFRRIRERRSNSGGKIIDLVPENPDYSILELNEQAGERIIATMVERRIYRNRRGKELLDSLRAYRTGLSSDT